MPSMVKREFEKFFEFILRTKALCGAVKSWQYLVCVRAKRQLLHRLKNEQYMGGATILLTYFVAPNLQ